jgi:hypothetical protein
MVSVTNNFGNYILYNGTQMSESAAGQAGATLSPEAYQEFENLVMA